MSAEIDREVDAWIATFDEGPLGANVLDDVVEELGQLESLAERLEDEDLRSFRRGLVTLRIRMERAHPAEISRARWREK